jgi:Glutaredoxin-like domain (DUF836)
LSARALTLLTREECGLCEQMLAELARLRAHHALPPLRLLDLDTEADPELQRRYTLKVPVLLLDGVLIASGRLDAGELLRSLARAERAPGPPGL